jgi:hypothetical protein
MNTLHSNSSNQIEDTDIVTEFCHDFPHLLEADVVTTATLLLLLLIQTNYILLKGMCSALYQVHKRFVKNHVIGLKFCFSKLKIAHVIREVVLLL